MPSVVGHVWTDRAKAKFLEILAETGNVSASAREIGIARSTAYKNRDENPEFSEQWDNAIEEATDKLDLEARRRAHDGYEEPVFYQGVECATVRKYSDTLMIQLLKAHHPAHKQKLQLGGDPDSPPIQSTAFHIDPDTIPEDERKDALKLAHAAVARGLKG